MLKNNRLQLWKAITLLVMLLASVVLGSNYLRESAKHKYAEKNDGSSSGEMPKPSFNSLVAQRAPHFEGTAVVDKELTSISLSQYTGKYVVLLFYPLDFSSVCASEVSAYSKRADEFEKLNAVIIACSVDSPYAHMNWLQQSAEEGGLDDIKIPLLSDITHTISQDYGVYMPTYGHSLRAQFIIDTKGIIRQATINDLLVARSVDETLRLVRSCNYVDRTGNVCAACTSSLQKLRISTAMNRVPS